MLGGASSCHIQADCERCAVPQRTRRLEDAPGPLAKRGVRIPDRRLFVPRFVQETDWPGMPSEPSMTAYAGEQTDEVKILGAPEDVDRIVRRVVAEDHRKRAGRKAQLRVCCPADRHVFIKGSLVVVLGRIQKPRQILI